MKIKERQSIFRYFIPQYDEVALFTMSFTFALLLITGVLSNYTEIQLDSPREYDPRMIAAFLIFIAGLALSFYHAFTDRPKTRLEKSFMLFFAVLLNAFSGIMAGIYSLTSANGWLILFPILNIINGAVLLFMFRAGVLDESNISDQNASRGQIALAAAIVLILFFVCNIIYKLIWVETLSICLVYSTNLIDVIESLVFRLPPTSRIT